MTQEQSALVECTHQCIQDYPKEWAGIPIDIYLCPQEYALLATVFHSKQLAYPGVFFHCDMYAVPLMTSRTARTCECGAAKVNSSLYNTWCPAT
jgi:hypothetical protein